MAERSFTEEVQKLHLGDGDEFAGEGILAITKALLQAGVSYVAGYQGAPISHLMDVLADANDILEEPRRPLRILAPPRPPPPRPSPPPSTIPCAAPSPSSPPSAPTSPPTRSRTSPPAASPAARC